jgi:hypothetical protein
MSRHLSIMLLTVAVTCGCALPGRNRQPAPGVTEAAQSPSLGQECSSLRADIASARYKQQTLPPTSTSPIIADAATAKTDQRIDAMRQRYDSLECSKIAPAKLQADPPPK